MTDRDRCPTGGPRSRCPLRPSRQRERCWRTSTPRRSSSPRSRDRRTRQQGGPRGRSEGGSAHPVASLSLRSDGGDAPLGAPRRSSRSRISTGGATRTSASSAPARAPSRSRSRGSTRRSSGWATAGSSCWRALDADTPVGRFLAKRGPGMHHVAYEVDDIRAALAHLSEAGAELIDHTPRRGPVRPRGRLRPSRLRARSPVRGGVCSA